MNLPQGKPNADIDFDGWRREQVEAAADRKLGLPTLEYVFGLALVHKWAILAIMAASLLVALAVTLLATPMYTAVSTIEISRIQDNVTDVEGVEATELGKEVEFFQTQYALLKARSLAERVVRVLNLPNNQEFFDSFGIEPETSEDSSAPQPEGQPAAGRSERRDLAVEILLNQVEIQPIRGSSLVNVNFTSPSPRMSADITRVWVDQYIAANLDRRFASTADAREFLEERLGELRRRLEDSERELVTYASNSGIIALSSTKDAEGATLDEHTLVSADLEAMNKALAEATADRVAAQSQMGGASGIITNQALNMLRQRRAEIAAERARLLSQFHEGYPAVQALTSQVEELDGAIAAEVRRFKAANRSRYDEASQREETLRSQVAELRSRFLEQERDSIQYNIYQREVDTNRQLYNALLQRYKEIGVAGVGANNISIIDRAKVPTSPSSPSLPLNLLMGLVAGLALSASYVFAREQVDQSLRDPKETRDLLGIANLGAVPHVSGDAAEQELRDRKSALSEAYFAIGANLGFLTEHGVPNSLLFTSTRPNEGKSFSAYAIASVLAATGRRVIVVDADMRSPSQHLLYGIENVAGLVDFLSGEDDLIRLIRSDQDQNHDLLTAGPVPPHAPELLSNPRMRNLVQLLGQTYDHVIVDAPPVLGLADVPLLSTTVEGVLFAIEANGARLRQIESALTRLRQANAHIYGAIVTKLDHRNEAYGYGYGYGYGHGYGERPAD